MPSSMANHGAECAPVNEELRPMVIKTSRGNVEMTTWGHGPAVLSLHGAMGGYDQGILLAKTAISPRHRFIAISRPGYLGTPLGAGRAAEEQADICAEILDHLGAFKVQHNAALATLQYGIGGMPPAGHPVGRRG